MFVEYLVVFIIALFLYRYWRKRDIYKLGRELKSGVTALPLLGHSYLFFGSNETRMKAFETLGRDAISKENGLTSFWLGLDLYTMIADPETAELVLKTSLQKDDVLKMATLFLGNGSVFAPVSIWRPRRKVLFSVFATKNMKHFLSIFIQQSGILVQQLNKVVDADIVSAWKYYTSYTMDTIAEATLGYQMHAQKDSCHPFLKAFDEGLIHGAERLVSPWLHSDLLYHNLPVYKKLLVTRDYLWSFIKKIVETKRREMKKADLNMQSSDAEDHPKTLVEMLIRASGGDEGYTDMEVLEETMVIMMAGNDTSAVAASFVSLMMSRYPDIQEKIFEELDEVFGDSDRPITPEDLLRLKYLDAVIKETLRLYSPVPVITRKIENQTILPSGIKLVPGTGVMINIWALHRNPRYWGEDAEVFRPERFLEAPLKHPAAFMPFSFGPRNCIGYQFAMTSLKTVLSSVFRRYKILPVNQESKQPPVRLQFDIMMKECDGCKIKLQLRNKTSTSTKSFR